MSNINILHQFEIKTEIDVDKVETKIEGEGADAKTITVTTKVKEPRSTFFAIRKPNRGDREECEIVRDVAFKYFIERGVITEGNLRKQYGDNGGVYTNEEETHYASLRERMRQLVTDYQGLTVSESEEDKKAAVEVFNKIFAIRSQIIEFEKTANLFYERTAEAKANKKAIEYYVLQLTYTHGELAADKPIEWAPFFKGTTHEEKLKSLIKMEDDLDTTYLTIRDRVVLVSMALVNNATLTPEQLEEQVTDAAAL